MGDYFGDTRHDFLEKCGFEYVEEFNHGTAIWKSKNDDELFLIAKPYGSFNGVTLIAAESVEEAIERHYVDCGISFSTKNPIVLELILKNAVAN